MKTINYTLESVTFTSQIPIPFLRNLVILSTRQTTTYFVSIKCPIAKTSDKVINIEYSCPAFKSLCPRRFFSSLLNTISTSGLKFTGHFLEGYSQRISDILVKVIYFLGVMWSYLVCQGIYISRNYPWLQSVFKWPLFTETSCTSRLETKSYLIAHASETTAHFWS